MNNTVNITINNYYDGSRQLCEHLNNCDNGCKILINGIPNITTVSTVGGTGTGHTAPVTTAADKCTINHIETDTSTQQQTTETPAGDRKSSKQPKSVTIVGLQALLDLNLDDYKEIDFFHFELTAEEVKYLQDAILLERTHKKGKTKNGKRKNTAATEEESESKKVRIVE